MPSPTRRTKDLRGLQVSIYTGIDSMRLSKMCPQSPFVAPHTMALASTLPPFRADHVGSLLRPKELREAFRKYGSEPVANPTFAQIQERAIRDVVKLQEEAGLQVVTDG